MSVRKRGGRAHKEGRRVGRGVALGVLLLIVGLVLGGAAALRLADQLLVRRVFNTGTQDDRGDRDGSCRDDARELRHGN
jgi:hypothetical protein